MDPTEEFLAGRYAQPPCSFFARVILEGLDGGSYARVRVVTEDRRNPCVKYLESRFPDKVIDLSEGMDF